MFESLAGAEENAVLFEFIVNLHLDGSAFFC